MSKAQDYVRILQDFGMRLEDESRWYRTLDLLWAEMNESECLEAEELWDSRSVPEAPEDLRMVDVPLKVGDRIGPRRTK